MRIGIFRPGMSKPGGTETFLMEIMKRLQDRHEICLVTDDGPLSEELEEMNIEIYRLPMIDRFYFLVKEWFEVESLTLYASSRFRKVFERIDADVWSTHYWLENLLLSRYLDTPNFFHFPGIKSPHIGWKIMKRFAEPDFYVANSKDTEERARKWLGIECEDIVYPGVDLEQFRPTTEPAFQNEDFNIMYVGRIDSGKGLFTLLKAFRKLGESYDYLRLWLVGEGSLKKELQSRAVEYGIEDKTEFPGKIDHSEIQKWYVASDLFCLPSTHESFGIVNLEAMACGVPIVTTDLPASRELIEEESEGIFFEKGDWRRLAERVKYLIENLDVRKELSRQARKRAGEFGWDEQAEKMERFYKNSIKE